MNMRQNITFLTGFYGSGKSEIAVNLAVQKHLDMVVDLDIINPYFRSREMEEELKKEGIATVSSDLDYKSHVDLPYISRRVFMPFHDKSLKAVYDLGGNDLGAKLLRQFEDYHDTPVDLFLVINIYRQETDTPEKILHLIQMIEGMGGYPVTGLINNTNLLRETTKEEVLAGQTVCEQVSQASGLPIVYTTVWEHVDIQTQEVDGEYIPLKLYFRKDWL
ncbi:MAG: ATP-binding protein [Bacilli bacterium]|nr:ATP-binding protein [Bacilli bacterium]MBN2877604.1 ATP-binding protein [Bacilli bacterium]